MTLTIRELIKIMEKYAPTNLKEDYDNVGLMVGDTDMEIQSILISLDCTMEVIEEAIENGCNLIISHHPLLFIKPKSITSETVKGRKIIKLIKENIALYSAHTNLDSVSGGLNDFAMELLGFKKYSIIEKNDLRENSGIGRLVELDKEISLKEICEKVKIAYNIETLKYSGNLDKKIRSIALINGSGSDFFYKAKSLGVECIITGDTTYHNVLDLCEEGVSVIDGGHFNTEWPAMSVVSKILQKNLKKLGYENKIILSEKTKDTYKYI
ncbi:Nif3-like dinuclear metal center hexameric protein [Hathewaya histolytica]|uniref:Nif3-like dinuclear metal center hexameric protein n=1 Tax=Hathewaya histolytica TaxID=1498 RepID=UPI003B66E8C1